MYLPNRYISIHQSIHDGLKKDKSDSIHGSLLAIDVVVTNGVFQKQRHLLDMCIMVGKLFDTKSSMHTKILVKVLPLLVDELLKSGTGAYHGRAGRCTRIPLLPALHSDVTVTSNTHMHSLPD